MIRALVRSFVDSIKHPFGYNQTTVSVFSLISLRKTTLLHLISETLPSFHWFSFLFSFVFLINNLTSPMSVNQIRVADRCFAVRNKSVRWFWIIELNKNYQRKQKWYSMWCFHTHNHSKTAKASRACRLAHAPQWLHIDSKAAEYSSSPDRWIYYWGVFGNLEQ